MSNGKKIRVRIKLNKICNNQYYLSRIVERFGLDIQYRTVNGVTEVSVREEDMELFEETARRGFFGILKRH